MEEGKTLFGLGYSLEYICSFTATLRREVIGPLAEGIRVNYHITGGEVDGPKLRGKFRPWWRRLRDHAPRWGWIT